MTLEVISNQGNFLFSPLWVFSFKASFWVALWNLCQNTLRAKALMMYWSGNFLSSTISFGQKHLSMLDVVAVALETGINVRRYYWLRLPPQFQWILIWIFPLNYQNCMNFKGLTSFSFACQNGHDYIVQLELT